MLNKECSYPGRWYVSLFGFCVCPCAEYSSFPFTRSLICAYLSLCMSRYFIFCYPELSSHYLGSCPRESIPQPLAAGIIGVLLAICLFGEKSHQDGSSRVSTWPMETHRPLPCQMEDRSQTDVICLARAVNKHRHSEKTWVADDRGQGSCFLARLSTKKDDLLKNWSLGTSTKFFTVWGSMVES